MYNLVICDDEVNICETLGTLVREEFNEQLNIKSTSNLSTFLERLKNGVEEIPDMVIMDICWDENSPNGIETAMNLQKEYPRMKVIFLTGNIQYAADIFVAKPSYFLVKPIEREKLIDALNKTMREIADERKAQIVLKNGGKIVNLRPADVIYVESDKHELIVHGVEGRQKVWMKLDDFLAQSDGYFIRVHQSFAVNPKFIRSFSMKNILMTDGNEIAVSRNRYKPAKDAFLDYLESRE